MDLKFLWVYTNKFIIYKQTLETGGNKMNKNELNFTYLMDSIITKDVFNDSRSLEIFSQILKLDSLLNIKIDEYKKFAETNNHYQSKLEWLLNWKASEKKDMLDSILSAITRGIISNRRLSILNEIISGYFDYFLILSQEPNSEERFEETFSTILQIPAEVYDFVRANEISYTAEFINNICYKSEDRKRSRQEQKQDDYIDFLCA